MDNVVTSCLVIGCAVAVAFVVFGKRVSHSRTWRATVTPLASIIGSGFLVLAPILGRQFGAAAVLVMLALCLISYALGAAIRANILTIDGQSESPPAYARRIEAAASWSLAFAYVISVTYYLNLFGAFAVSLTPFDSTMNGRIIATAMLVFLAALGKTRGLSGLEQVEQPAVGVKLAIIAGMLAGLSAYAISGADEGIASAASTPPLTLHSLAIAAGLIITVQGFETSRYLGKEYDAALRERTMRHAQWIATAIYLLFIGLASIVFSPGDIGTRETAVIGMTRAVTPVLPVLLVIAALASQFSAAVADLGGGGGLIHEATKGRTSAANAYVAFAVAGVLLTWMADIYWIISFASRAFAVYYGLQCALATATAYRSGSRTRATGFGLLAVGMVLVAVFGAPAE